MPLRHQGLPSLEPSLQLRDRGATTRRGWLSGSTETNWEEDQVVRRRSKNTAGGKVSAAADLNTDDGFKSQFSARWRKI